MILRYTHLGEGVLAELGEPGPGWPAPGGPEGHEESHHALTLHPPQLHGPLQLHRAVSLAVQEVEEASVLPVPAVVMGIED